MRCVKHPFEARPREAQIDSQGLQVNKVLLVLQFREADDAGRHEVVLFTQYRARSSG